jgi:hypothetical protein
MEIVYFTAVAAVLYLLADWLLERLEQTAGRRFTQRTLIFFALLLTLALASFSLIRRYKGMP